MTSEFAALLFCAALAALAVFQLLLTIGLPLGRFAWGGQSAVLPAKLRVGSLVAVVLYAVFAIVALDRAALLSVMPVPVVAVVAMWVIAAYLALSVIPNLLSKSRHERLAMAPVSIVLAGLALRLALG